MAEILHQLMGSLSHYLRRALYIPGGDRRISTLEMGVPNPQAGWHRNGDIDSNDILFVVPVLLVKDMTLDT